VRRGALTLMLSLLCLIGAECLARGIIVNEVMANEPGTSRRLEWVELYNDSSLSVRLSNYLLVVGTVVIELPDIRLRPDEYYIICQTLYATSAYPGFETYWGDSSGVWGDSPSETHIQTPFEARSLSLPNSGGAVVLSDKAFAAISVFGWDQVGLDGYSWERLNPQSDSIVQCVDLSGSTPGFINSLTPVPVDLAVDSIAAIHAEGLTTITAHIHNRGLTTVTDAIAHFLYPPPTPQGVPDTIGTAPIPDLQPGELIPVERIFSLPGVYVDVMVDVPADDRNRNNRRELVVPGNQYPPFYITEFLANPTTDLGTEWIELRNRLDIPFDIANWLIGDAQGFHIISEFELILAPGEYFILAQNASAFNQYYHGFGRPVIQPPTWPRLNNDVDEISLVDHLGILADYVAYTQVYPDNFTWCRGEESPNINRWGRSSVPGGSPGGANQVVFETRIAPVTMSADPPVFAARAGHGPDSTAFIITAPSDESYSLRIFDRQGRVVRTFADRSPIFYDRYTWRGEDDNGALLPIGTYIALYEVDGVGTVKLVVVIAR